MLRRPDLCYSLTTNQHGTAIIGGVAPFTAAEIAGKEPSELNVVDAQQAYE